MKKVYSNPEKKIGVEARIVNEILHGNKDNLIVLLEEDAKLKNGVYHEYLCIIYQNSQPLIVDVHLLFLFVCCRQ